MLSFNQNRSHSLEQSLKEGYAQMADLNLSRRKLSRLSVKLAIVMKHILLLTQRMND